MTDNAFTLGQGIPCALVAGDLWAWRDDALADPYPAATYSLTYSIAPQSGGTATTATATLDADGWLVSIAAATTAPLAAGAYAWTLFATRISDGARLSIHAGVLEVKPDPSTAADARSQAKKHLDAINAVLDNRITKDVENYAIEGRALTRTPLEILHKLRARYLAEVQGEDRAASGKGPGRFRKLRY